jgi:hypothetical protein
MFLINIKALPDWFYSKKMKDFTFEKILNM